MDIEKLEQHLKKNLEFIKTLEIKVKNLHKKGLISDKELIKIIYELKTIIGQIHYLISLIKKYKTQKKIDKVIQKLPLPQTIKEYSKKKLIEREEKIKKENFDRIIIKRELIKKIRYKDLEKKIKKQENLLEKTTRKKGKNFFGLKSFKANLDLSKYPEINKIFDFFLVNFNFIYMPIFEALDKLKLNRFQKHLLATAYTLFFVFLSYITTVLFSLIILYYLEIITDLDLIKKVAKYSIILGVFVVFILVFYPYYYVKQKEKEIEEVLPFALVHMSAIASSGVNFYLITKMIAETEEYKSLSEIFKKIILLVDTAGLDLISAIKEVSEEVPSKKLKEILNSIIYITKTGGDLTQYLNQKAEEAILNLKISKEKYLGFLDVFSDLYVILIVSIPILFVSVIAVLSSFSPSEKLYKIAKLGTYVIIPILDIAFLLLLNFQQKT